MRREFSSFEVIPIDKSTPDSITSMIEVADLPGMIRDVNVMIDLNHTWTNDLRIHLEAPDGTAVRLVEGEGGKGDNFRRTKFDDAAAKGIEGAKAPFRGTFRPEGALTDFNGKEADGTWSLHVEDTAWADGGSLNRWSLSIETCAHVFDKNTPAAIGAGAPNVVTSKIDTGNMGGLVVGELTVMVDIDHTWDQDLKISLIAPDSTAVVLVDRKGGDQDGFDHTTFDDSADKSIAEGSAPFAGTFRPEQPLSGLHGNLLSGTWTLKIEDKASEDGGKLNRWVMSVLSCTATPRTPTEFSIDLEFVGGLNANQRSVFELAAARWAEVITGDLPSGVVDGQEIDDLLIKAEGKFIDGTGGILGRAGPRWIRNGTNLPIVGEMTFDSADLADMEEDGTLMDVILHEMGHVLGIGTIWDDNGLIAGDNDDPEFTGAGAMGEYATLLGATAPQAVPVANTGGPGTAGGHWREVTFDHELMTGYAEQGEMPMSRMTIASLQDLGYQVDLGAAHAYQLPDPGLMAARAVEEPRRACRTICPKTQVVPEGGGAPRAAGGAGSPVGSVGAEG